jgi:putative phage-type endonuclease
MVDTPRAVDLHSPEHLLLGQDPEWLEQRQGGVGGSDVAALVGLDKYRSSWDVYRSKVDPPEQGAPSEAALWGTLMQDVIVREWSRRCQVGTTPGVLIRHPEYPFALGTPDYLTEEAPSRLVEVKAVGSWAWDRDWEEGAVVPPYYLCQVQWYLGITGLRDAVVVALVGGNHLEAFEVKRDDNAIRSLLIAAQAFWQGHVIPRRPPEPGGSARATADLTARYAAPEHSRRAVLPPGATDVLREYLDCRELAAEYGRRQTAAANWLRQALGEAEADEGVLPGEDAPAVTWKPMRVLDVEALKADLTPEQIERYGRITFDIGELERELGKARLAKYRRNGEGRRLYVSTHAV